MIENVKARWGIIIAVFVGALMYLAPNVVDVGEDWFFSSNKLVYGLDIQGGVHLVMGVDVQGVLNEKRSRLARSMETELKDESVAFQSIETPESEPSELRITLGSKEDVDKLTKYVEETYPFTLQVVDQQDQQVTLRYFDAEIIKYKKQVVDQAIEVIRNRIDEFGVSEPSIAAQGSDRILVQLPGIKDSARAKELINRTAQMSFRPVSNEVDGDQLSKLIAEAETTGDYALGKNEMRYGAYIKRLNEDLKDKIPAGSRVVFEKMPSAVNLEAGKIPYLLKPGNGLTGGELEDASVRPDEFGKPEVVFSFTVDGRRKFAELTEQNVGGLIAIVLDDVVQSAPQIREKINSPTARITLGSTRDYQTALEEAQFIATALRAGALPAALEQLEERTVGPTLGADSIAKGKTAGLVGLALVLLFMLVYYRTLGVVANLALTFNVLLVIAALTSLGATLTLPGVAGIILTVGMAVDANVIIFERIKEELSKGAGLKSAVKDGFGHALSAIVDANVTTAAVCVVLMYFGTGPVRGFAVTLLCGVVTSMFTSIFFSRSVIDLLIQRFKLQKLA